MKNLIPIVIISISLLSCNKITVEDLQGNWTFTPSNWTGKTINSIPLDYSELIIRKQNAELIDQNLYKEVGELELKDNNISILLDRDSVRIELKIDVIDHDTLTLDNGQTLMRNFQPINAYHEAYELIGIPNPQLLSDIENYTHIIHLYKSLDNQLRIRYSTKFAELEDIPILLERHSSLTQTKVVLFIGKGVKLLELKQLLLVLSQSGVTDIYLATKKSGINDTEVFRDRIELWWDDVVAFRKSLKKATPTSPLHPFLNKETYLDFGTKVISIESQNDFSNLSTITDENKYLIEISVNLSLDQYIKLKKEIKIKRKTNRKIRTSLN